MSELSNRLRDRRQELGYSQLDLSIMIQRDHSTISKLESGERLPSVEILRDLSKALELYFMSLMADRVRAQLVEGERVQHFDLLEQWRKLADGLE